MRFITSRNNIAAGESRLSEGIGRSIIYTICIWLVLFGFNLQYDVTDQYFVRDLPSFAVILLKMGRPVVGIGIITLFLMTIFNRVGGRLIFSMGVLSIFIFRLILAVRRMLSEGTLESAIKESVGICFIAIMIMVFCWRTRWSGNALEFTRRYSQVAIWVIIPYILICSSLAFFRPGAVFNVPGRLFGLNSHPNEFAISISMLLLLSLYGESRNGKYLRGIFMVIFVAVLVVLSGSRVGMLTFIFPLLFFVLNAIKRIDGVLRLALAFVGVPVLVATVLVLSVIQMTSDLRVFSTENTRQQVFTDMFENFQANPLWGNPEGTGATSNSFLYAASSTGLVGSSFLALSILMIAGTMFSLRRLPSLEKTFIYMGGGAVFSSMIFSGYLCEYIQFPLIFTLLWLGILYRFDEDISRFRMRAAQF